MTESLRPLDFRDEVEEEKAAHDKRIMDQLFDQRAEALCKLLKRVADREPGWDGALLSSAFVAFARLAGGTATGVMPFTLQNPQMMKYECHLVISPLNSNKSNATSPPP